ncbi:glucose-6-phosphate isomerase [Patescibacteria group bacterium]|nr:glucose-6-phosphate isomerase [Patescibacteria group bacterium]
MVKTKPKIRFLKEMENVLYDQRWAKTAQNFELYYVWRGIKEKNSLRYDITSIPSRMLGREFVKTKGHEHSNKYGEIYFILKGEVIFLMQKCKGNVVKDVYVVKAKRGDFIVVSPNFGHLAINSSNSELKMANWINKKCKNDYRLFEKKQGACYYYTKSGWIKNKNYKKIPKLRWKKPLKKMPKNLDFLK